MSDDTVDAKTRVLTPQQRGAMITHSGRPPIAGLPVEERNALLQRVMSRYLDDEELPSIAQDVGVSYTGLYQAIVKYIPDEWISAQGARALHRMERAEKQLEEATDMLTVARARELLRSTQWQTERTLRRLYGNDIPKTDSGRINITLNVGSQHKVAHDQNNITINQEDT